MIVPGITAPHHVKCKGAVSLTQAVGSHLSNGPLAAAQGPWAQMSIDAYDVPGVVPDVHMDACTLTS